MFTTDDDPEALRELLRERGVSGRLQRSETNAFFWFYDLDGNRFEVSRAA